MQAIIQIPMNLQSVEFFHSDRGKEFDNHLIDECLTEFVSNSVFNTLESLD